MTLGERCDEIVRLIDETLEACTLGPGAFGEPATQAADPATEPPMVGRVRALAQLHRQVLARSA